MQRASNDCSRFFKYIALRLPAIVGCVPLTFLILLSLAIVASFSSLACSGPSPSPTPVTTVAPPTLYTRPPATSTPTPTNTSTSTPTDTPTPTSTGTATPTPTHTQTVPLTSTSPITDTPTATRSARTPTPPTPTTPAVPPITLVSPINNESAGNPVELKWEWADSLADLGPDAVFTIRWGIASEGPPHSRVWCTEIERPPECHCPDTEWEVDFNDCDNLEERIIAWNVAVALVDWNTRQYKQILAESVTAFFRVKTNISYCPP
jgi:hypothetical protein